MAVAAVVVVAVALIISLILSRYTLHQINDSPLSIR